jgi:hypothetical protein
MRRQGTRGSFASESNRIPAIMSAIRRTGAHRRLHGLQRRRQVILELPNGRRALHRVRPGFLAYLLQPKELFARAYAQYVALASGDEAIRRELLAIQTDTLSSQVYHEQWLDDDFQPVALAIEAALRRRGWRP